MEKELKKGSIFRITTDKKLDIYFILDVMGHTDKGTMIFVEEIRSAVSSMMYIPEEKFDTLVFFNGSDEEFFEGVELDKEYLLESLKGIDRILGHSEEIKNPERYTSNNIECWDFIHQYKLDFFVGSATKYVWRHKYKGGKKDLEKALVYLDKLLTYELPLFERDENFVFNLPNHDDYENMDNHQIAILYTIARLMTLPNDKEYRKSINTIKEMIEEYINEYY